MSKMPENPVFGAVELRLFRATSVLFAGLAFCVLIAAMIWTLGLFLSYFYNLIMPLCVAGILALVLNPMVDWLERFQWMNRLAATLIVVLLAVGVAAGAFLVVVPSLIREGVLFAETAMSVLARWHENIVDAFPGLARFAEESAKQGEIKEVMPDFENTGQNLMSFGGLLAGLSFVPLLLFFALLSGKHLRERITRELSVFSAATQKKVLYFIDVFLAQVTGFFQGQLVIGLIMGVMYAIGFSLIGLKGAILIGLFLGLLNIVPYLGMLLGLIIVLPLSLVQPSGGVYLFGLSLLVFTVVQLVESWLLTPKIMANRSGLHPALVVIAVFFWGLAFGGIAGMVLAVPLTAFLIAAWKQAKPALERSMTAEQDAIQVESPTGKTPGSRTKVPRVNRGEAGSPES